MARFNAIFLHPFGFPAASETDFQIVNKIAEMISAKRSPMTVAALCQLRESQMVRTIEALTPCIKTGTGRVHTYVPVDPHLMEASLGKMAAQKIKIVQIVEQLVKMAVDAGFEVEFSPEGYSRMGDNVDFTSDVICAAVSGGARVINCPDTIGGASRVEGGDYFVHRMAQHATMVRDQFPERDVVWSAHCHNDFGLALDNSMNAVFEGPARQIEGCMNGVGERAGNAAIEQCIVYIHEFGARAAPEDPFHTQIDMSPIKAASDFIAEKMLPRQPHFPIVGDNAAQHSSGGHINALLKNPRVYQPYDPEQIGNKVRFAFGPLSGSNYAKTIIEKYGYECGEHEKVEIAQSIKDYYSDRRKGNTEEELIKGYQRYREQA